MFFLAACGQKNQIQEEARQIRSGVAEHRAALRALEAESAAVGDLGKYNQPRPEHVKELQGKIERLQADKARLLGDKERKLAELAKLEGELDAYQTKFPPR